MTTTLIDYNLSPMGTTLFAPILDAVLEQPLMPTVQPTTMLLYDHLDDIYRDMALALDILQQELKLHTDDPSIWLGSEAAYGDAKLVGMWVSLPTETEYLSAVIDILSVGGRWDTAIMDTSATDGVAQSLFSATCNPQRLNDCMDELDGLYESERDAVGYLMAVENMSVKDALASYEDVRWHESWDAVIDDYVENSLLSAIPRPRSSAPRYERQGFNAFMNTLRGYIDYDAIKRDMKANSEWSEWNGGLWQYTR